MAKLGRPKKKTVKEQETPTDEQPQDAEIIKEEEAEPSPQPDEVVTSDEQPVEYEAKATTDCWRYHDLEEPKFFRAGQIIPEGWSDEDHIGWTPDESGRMVRK